MADQQIKIIWRHSRFGYVVLRCEVIEETKNTHVIRDDSGLRGGFRRIKKDPTRDFASEAEARAAMVSRLEQVILAHESKIAELRQYVERYKDTSA